MWPEYAEYWSTLILPLHTLNEKFRLFAVSAEEHETFEEKLIGT